MQMQREVLNSEGFEKQKRCQKSHWHLCKLPLNILQLL